MPKYDKPVWQLVLEAAQEVGDKPFAPKEIINRVIKKNPNVKKVTIACHVIGMSPDHPSSKHYPSLSKNHPAFTYLGKGQFQILDMLKKSKDETIKPKLPEGPKIAEWEKLRLKICNLQGDISDFKADLLDRDTFKKFCDNMVNELQNYNEICVTGYFSETIREELNRIVQMGRSIKLISPEFTLGTPRDRKNLEALKKLSESGVKVKLNLRLHARFLIAYNLCSDRIYGILVIGSFDFNNECIGRERYDAGIKTQNPDLIESAIEFFNKVWIDSETLTLEDFLKAKKVS